MSSPKGSSSGKGSGKRKIDATLETSRKKGSGTEQGKASSSRAKKVKSEAEYLNVYVVKFDTDRPGSDYHASLLVELHREPCGFDRKREVSRGDIYEVIGPYEDLDNPGICEFEFRMKSLEAPENADSFVSKSKIGRIASDRCSALHDICKRSRLPQGQVGYEGRPDCSDWLHNVICELNQDQVMEFTGDYSPPKSLVSVVQT